jgi:hypothetical protein
MSPVTGMPTQCYFDVVLVPLPTWIYIALGLVIFPLVLRGLLADKLHRMTYKRHWHRIVHLTLYYFFIAVIILMESVEVGRLEQINYGIGLLPFVYVGCLLAAAQHLTRHAWGRLLGWQVASVIFWAMSIAVAVAKIVALNKLPDTEEYRRDSGPYSVFHQLNDINILMAFYIILLITEITLLLWKPWGATTRTHVVEEVGQKA